MDTITCIKTRRSIRQFKEQEVTKDVLEDIVQTASFAPSWKNTQTTRYIAITDPKVKDWQRKVARIILLIRRILIQHLQ